MAEIKHKTENTLSDIIITENNELTLIFPDIEITLDPLEIDNISKAMQNIIEKERIIATIRSFCDINDGDDATQSLLIAVGAEILDCSEDNFLEMMHDPTIDISLNETDEPTKCGVWITYDDGFTVCSNCGEEHEWVDFRPSYCDMCGSKNNHTVYKKAKTY